MLRYLTAGESHGQALVAILEGMPAGVPVQTKDIAAELARRRLGYGRGARMRFEQDRLELLGGVFEVAVHGLPPGLGSYVQWDRKLDARLAAALMSIQAIKGVEVGDGFAGAAKPGSRAHDEIVPGEGSRPRRRTGRAGGIEGGMSTGEVLRVRAAMKPLSTLVKALGTVDVATGAPARAVVQRSDVTAVPAAAVVGEAAVALVLADALLEKTGGDSLAEVRRNLDAYLAAVERR